LHARPAAVFAQAAKGFSASIHLHKQQESANAKSLVAIMALQTAFGDIVQVSAAGRDAEEAISTLAALLTGGCGETVAVPTPVEALEPSSLKVLRGVCASPGSGFGQVVQIAEQTLEVSEPGRGA
ncbi:HPr family phosphocarrier protein, partial [Pseudomonas neuropathica]